MMIFDDACSLHPRFDGCFFLRKVGPRILWSDCNWRWQGRSTGAEDKNAQEGKSTASLPTTNQPTSQNECWDSRTGKEQVKAGGFQVWPQSGRAGGDLWSGREAKQEVGGGASKGESQGVAGGGEGTHGRAEPREQVDSFFFFLFLLFTPRTITRPIKNPKKSLAWSLVWTNRGVPPSSWTASCIRSRESERRRVNHPKEITILNKNYIWKYELIILTNNDILKVDLI